MKRATCSALLLVVFSAPVIAGCTSNGQGSSTVPAVGGTSSGPAVGAQSTAQTKGTGGQSGGPSQQVLGRWLRTIYSNGVEFGFAELVEFRSDGSITYVSNGSPDGNWTLRQSGGKPILRISNEGRTMDFDCTFEGDHFTAENVASQLSMTFSRPL
jgi:hypothetical protein